MMTSYAPVELAMKGTDANDQVILFNFSLFILSSILIKRLHEPKAHTKYENAIKLSMLQILTEKIQFYYGF